MSIAGIILTLLGLTAIALVIAGLRQLKR